MAMPDAGYLSLVDLAKYSAMSTRTLRRHLEDTTHPLPAYRIGGKVLIKRSEYDEWAAEFRTRGRPSLAAAMKELGLA